MPFAQRQGTMTHLARTEYGRRSGWSNVIQFVRSGGSQALDYRALAQGWHDSAFKSFGTGPQYKRPRFVPWDGELS